MCLKKKKKASAHKEGCINCSRAGKEHKREKQYFCMRRKVNWENFMQGLDTLKIFR